MSDSEKNTIKRKARDKTTSVSKKPEEFKKLVTDLLETDSLNVAIFTHDSPDPDSIASAIGLRHLLINIGANASIYYGGKISHPQNRVMKNLLASDMFEANKFNRELYNRIAIVDVSRTGAGNMLSLGEGEADWIFDHHESGDALKHEWKDVRLNVGSTSAIITNYIKTLSIPLEKENQDHQSVATAMLIGIKNDTKDMTSNVSQIDGEGIMFLSSLIDQTLYNNIMKYPLPMALLDMKKEAAENRQTKDSVMVTGIRHISLEQKDMLPIIADEYVRLDGIETVIVIGIVGGSHVSASVRSISATVNVNEFCHMTFGSEHSGGKGSGGYGEGGAFVPLNMLSADDMPQDYKERLFDLVLEKVKVKSFAALHVTESNMKD